MNTAISLKKDVKIWVDKLGFMLLHDPEVTEEEGRYSVKVFVDDPRALIGERGKNLRSFQTLFRMASGKKYGPELKIDIDVNGYKQKREEFLRDFAQNARRKALRDEEEVELEPMNAFDRRVIHATLSEYNDVKTESRGEHPERRVVVSLA